MHLEGYGVVSDCSVGVICRVAESRGTVEGETVDRGVEFELSGARIIRSRWKDAL
jgi:hypothetical protein